ncbi:hypothetical protein CCH79_00017150, partial [Gambusia affinis]
MSPTEAEVMTKDRELYTEQVRSPRNQQPVFRMISAGISRRPRRKSETASERRMVLVKLQAVLTAPVDQHIQSVSRLITVLVDQTNGNGDMQLHTPTNILILSLAVSDFLVGLLLIPLEIYRSTACWFLGDVVCVLYCYLVVHIVCASTGNIVLISVDRYVAICDPLHYPTRFSTAKAKCCVCVCWLWNALYGVFFLKDDMIQVGRSNSCTGECALLINYVAGTLDVVLNFVFPSTVIIVLYTRVFVVAVSQARAVRSRVAVVTLQHPQSSTATKSELRAARTLGILIVIYLACFCPYCCYSLIEANLSSTSHGTLLVFLFYLNSCLNPVIYALFYSWFRKAIKRIISLQILEPGSLFSLRHSICLLSFQSPISGKEKLTFIENLHRQMAASQNHQLPAPVSGRIRFHGGPYSLSSSCLNPLIYAMFYPWFRKAIKHIVTLKIFHPGSSKANILMEIQDRSDLCFPLLLNSSCRKPTLHWSEVVLLNSVLLFISLITVVLNLLIIISVSHFRQTSTYRLGFKNLHTPTNILLLSLGVSDFFVGLLLMPFEIYRFTFCWFLGDTMCVLFWFLISNLITASIWNIVLISVDRYVAICYPLHYPTRISLTRIKYCVCLCWFCASSCSFFYTKDELIQPGRYNSCIGE